VNYIVWNAVIFFVDKKEVRSARDNDIELFYVGLCENNVLVLTGNRQKTMSVTLQTK